MEIDNYLSKVINKQTLEYIVEGVINIAAAYGELKNRCNFMRNFTLDEAYDYILDNATDIMTIARTIIRRIINDDAKNFVRAVYQLIATQRRAEAYVKAHLPKEDKYTLNIATNFFDSVTNFIHVLYPYYADVRARFQGTISEMLSHNK